MSRVAIPFPGPLFLLSSITLACKVGFPDSSSARAITIVSDYPTHLGMEEKGKDVAGVPF